MNIEKELKMDRYNNTFRWFKDKFFGAGIMVLIGLAIYGIVKLVKYLIA